MHKNIPDITEYRYSGGDNVYFTVVQNAGFKLPTYDSQGTIRHGVHSLTVSNFYLIHVSLTINCSLTYCCIRADLSYC